jgi:pimeloyl-ACP methyl ester carboxylesterase
MARFNTTLNKMLIAAVSVTAVTLPAYAADADAATTATTVVLVHGAFADGSAWNKVIPLLQAKGVKVVAVQNPLTSLTDDAAAVQRVVDAQTGKVVLVGHSWGGAVITQAGSSDKIKALVYVAAFAPSKGEAVGALGQGYPIAPGPTTFRPDANGFIYMTPESLAANFAQDLPAAEVRLIAATQGPLHVKGVGEPLSYAAWETKPSYYIVASQDRMIAPEMERDFAKKMHATTTELNGSHSVMLSQPAKVAEVILAAVARP